MKKRSIVIALSIAAAFAAAPAMAQSTLVKFDGGIGVIPVSNVTQVNVIRNDVRGVPSAGQIWVIRELKADVKDDGRIRVDGRGLLFGGGNNVGLTTGQSVFATLICEATAPFTERSTAPAGVALEPNGDFRIDDILDMPTTDCASPVLLIRNAGNRAWFAAGIPRR